MIGDQAVRVVVSWLSNLRIDYIARAEGLSVREVERIIARAATISRFKLGGKDGVAIK